MDTNVLKDVLASPLKRQLPNRPLRHREAVKKLVEEKLQVTMGSSEYKDFIRILETQVAKDTRKGVCLTCWTYINEAQKKLHESYSHQCVAHGKIYDEKSFLHYAKLFNNLTWDGLIMLIKPFNCDNIGRDKLQHLNTLSHELKSRRDNRGNFKGSPPFLATPLCTLSMVPNGITSSSIMDRKEVVAEPSVPMIEAGPTPFAITSGKPERSLNYGPLATGYTAESRDKLCRILGACADEIASIQRQNDEILHKLSLIAGAAGLQECKGPMT